MTIPVSVVKCMFSNQIREKVNIQLNKLIDSIDLRHIEIDIFVDDLDVTEFKNYEIEQSKLIWEDIVKLSLHYFADYEYNRQFIFQSRYDDREYAARLVNLGFVLENYQWKSVRKPNLKDVQTNLFTYFLYRSIWDKMAVLSENDQNAANERKCDEIFKKNVNNEDIFDEFKVYDSNVTRVSDIQLHDSEQYAGTLNDVEYDDKWKCGKCGFSNKYIFGKCIICSTIYKDGSWTCGQCKMNNSCASDSCGYCCEVNNNIYTNDAFAIQVPDIDNLTSNPDNVSYNLIDLNNGDITCLPEDKWKCVTCNSRQYYKYKDCQVCDSSRLLYGLWQCVKCTCVNYCENEICDACGQCNNYLPVKYSQEERVTGTEKTYDYSHENNNIDWICYYRSCGVKNNSSDQYCYRCGLWCYNSHNRGDQCKWNNGIKQNVWVCHKCDTPNSLTDRLCSNRSCKETRYQKIRCTKCRMNNSGTTMFCLKCNEKLL